MNESMKHQAVGIYGNLHRWLMGYVINRQQFTDIYSSTLPIEYGVPQGSLLGPRLYTIYVNDLPDFVTTGDVFMYADDTTIYCTGPDVKHVISNLNSVMEQISLWSMNNKLIIHPAKTEAIILKKTPFVGPLLPILFCSGFVNIVTSTTCLDVTIDNKLSWSVHIEKVKNSYSKKVSALRRMRHCTNTSYRIFISKLLSPV